MTIYWILLAYVISICAIVPYFSFKNKKRTIVFLCVLGIVLLQGLRAYTVGTDLKNYIPAFLVSDRWGLLSGFKYQNYELGFSLLLQFLRRAGFNETALLFFISGIIHLLIGIVIYKYSKMPVMSFIIYICMGVFAFTFSGLRQSLAIAILFFSYVFIKNRKLIPYLLCIGLSMSMHASAIVFLPAYWLFNIRIRRIHFIAIIPFTIGVFVFRRPLYVLIYYLYKGGSPLVKETGAYEMLLLMILIYITSYLFDVKGEGAGEVDSDLNAYRNLMLIAVIIQIFTSQSDVIGRAGYYYFIFASLLIPEFICKQRGKQKMLIICGLTLFLFFFFWWTTLRTGSMNIVPYKFYWQN